MAKYDCVAVLQKTGISEDDARALRRISMTLRRWFELECGTESGAIQRDEKWAVERAAWAKPDRWWDGKSWNTLANRRTYDDAGKAKIADSLPPDAAFRLTGERPYLTFDSGLGNGKRTRIPTPDRERGAKARLARIMKTYPTLGYYVQGDPRGAALYILRPGDVPEGSKADECYSRGLAVY